MAFISAFICLSIVLRNFCTVCREFVYDIGKYSSYHFFMRRSCVMCLHLSDKPRCAAGETSLRNTVLEGLIHHTLN